MNKTIPGAALISAALFLALVQSAPDLVITLHVAGDLWLAARLVGLFGLIILLRHYMPQVRKWLDDRRPDD
jgi:hypothetical protein